jgi:hypothetical protein
MSTQRIAEAVPEPPATFYELVENVCRDLYIQSLKQIPPDVVEAIRQAAQRETKEVGRRIFSHYLQSIEYALDSAAPPAPADRRGLAEPGHHCVVGRPAHPHPPVQFRRYCGDAMALISKIAALYSQGCIKLWFEGPTEPGRGHPADSLPLQFHISIADTLIYHFYNKHLK